MSTTRARCVFCFDSGGLVRTGCACRGECAVVHVRCLVRAVVASGSQQAWVRCRLCNQEYTGPVSCALARVRSLSTDSDSPDAFFAEVHAIDALCESQKSLKAERRARALLASTVARRGEESDEACIVKLRVAIALVQQSRLAEAALIVVSALDNEALKCQTLTMLARIMHTSSRYSEAERVWRSLPVQEPSAALVTRVLLCETLAAQGALCVDEIDRVVVDARRVFGAEHGLTRKATALRDVLRKKPL